MCKILEKMVKQIILNLPSLKFRKKLNLLEAINKNF